MISYKQRRQIELVAEARKEQKNPSQHRIMTIDGSVFCGYISGLYTIDGITVVDLRQRDSEKKNSFRIDEIKSIQAL